MTLRRRSRGQRSERRNPEQEPKTMEAEDASVGEAAEKVTPKSNHQYIFRGRIRRYRTEYEYFREKYR